MLTGSLTRTTFIMLKLGVMFQDKMYQLGLTSCWVIYTTALLILLAKSIFISEW